MTKEYVIDSNILFSAFMSGKDIYQLMFSENEIYIPDYAFSEIEKYKKRILSKTKLKESDLKEFVIKLLSNVIVVPNLLISEDSLIKAYHLCHDIDEKDTVYIALSIEFDFEVITSDKKLYNGLRKKNFTKIVLLKDVIEQLVKNKKAK